MAGPKNSPLAGKVAIVTGGARNIGRGVALALAEDGAAVVVNARMDCEAAAGVVGEIEAAGGRAMAHVGDITDEAVVAAMVEATVKAYGGIDILISNAAFRRQQPFLEITLADWHEILSVPLDGAFLTARACIPHMRNAGGGSIVTLGGVSAHIGTAGRAHVCASKAGLVGLTHALAMEFAAENIRVNCVAPGSIDTARPATAGVRPPGMDDKIPMRRQGQVAEITGMIRHLCRPEGAYVTGQTIHVNGGLFLV